MINLKVFKIKTKDGRQVSFVLNSAQQLIKKTIQQIRDEGKKVRLVILKGRQMGSSAFFERLALGEAMTRPDYTGFILAHDQRSVKDLFKNHIKYSFDTLPEVVRRLYKIDRDNMNEIRFESPEVFNSSVSVGTSARSKTIDFLHISEAAYISKDEAKWTELFTGSIEAANAGDIVMETTARGFDRFHRFYTNIRYDTRSQWKVLFLPWTLDGGYAMQPPVEDDGWRDDYAKLAKLYNLNPKPDLTDSQLYFYYQKAKDLGQLVMQEYPLTEEEAFISSSDTLINPQIISEAQRNAKEPVATAMGVNIYKQPEQNNRYVVAVDPATGEGEDNFSIDVMDQHGEQCAHVSLITSPEYAAQLAVGLAQRYGNALLGCEINGAGIATMNEIMKLGYPEHRVYQRIMEDRSSPQPTRRIKFGWSTSGKTRPVMLSEFRAAFEQGDIVVHSPVTLDEFRTFVNIDGKYQAESGCHDDAAMSIMIAYQLVQHLPEY
jgi:hypothetical protein